MCHSLFIFVVSHLEVHSDSAVGKRLEVDDQYLQGHVVVVEFIVAHGDVHVERQVVPVF